ncbi:MAG TPA: c-type cytochrome [Haliangium sp.]|nr:c-type cytochrome [Haliangium sp.]
MTMLSMLSILVMLMALGGCGKEEAAKQAPQAGPSPNAQAEPGKPSAAAVAEAKNVFQLRCVICHGENGKGDGPGAASLNPKPRNYTDKEWQKSVTDEDLKQVISKGGAALGKSPVMPPSPDLAQKPEVLDALIVMIRGFAQP